LYRRFTHPNTYTWLTCTPHQPESISMRHIQAPLPPLTLLSVQSEHFLVEFVRQVVHADVVVGPPEVVVCVQEAVGAHSHVQVPAQETHTHTINNHIDAYGFTTHTRIPMHTDKRATYADSLPNAPRIVSCTGSTPPSVVCSSMDSPMRKHNVGSGRRSSSCASL
jgi:hypothetical protein